MTAWTLTTVSPSRETGGLAVSAAAAAAAAAGGTSLRRCKLHQNRCRFQTAARAPVFSCHCFHCIELLSLIAERVTFAPFFSSRPGLLKLGRPEPSRSMSRIIVWSSNCSHCDSRTSRPGGLAGTGLTSKSELYPSGPPPSFRPFIMQTAALRAAKVLASEAPRK